MAKEPPSHVSTIDCVFVRTVATEATIPSFISP